MSDPDEPPPRRELRLDAMVEMLGNRVAKNARHLGKWARRQGVSCYRIYDRDIPEVPITIDTYEGALVVGDYRHVHPDTNAKTGGDAWLDAAGAAAAKAIGAAPEQIFVKHRERMVGRREGHQYERLGDEGAWRTVKEAGLSFWVNLSDYLDTGLFLDHRMTRARVAAEPGAQTMLNLFAYTGAFSVHAAAKGMATTTVDLSKTYLEWAERNLTLNGNDLARHRLVHADVRAFLDEARGEGRKWDVVVVDPPTFSNSKRMDYTWDVQRDHGALLFEVARVVSPGGVIWFSTNRRRFTLEPGALPPGAIIRDETAATIPPDFRDQRIHHAFRIAL
jgi:23S rRNA (cytosine1962-C5)-methyltransferase